MRMAGRLLRSVLPPLQRNVGLFSFLRRSARPRRLFFFLCGAGCTYTAVQGTNPLSLLPLGCCYTYDFLALAFPPLQQRRSLFYISLNRGVTAFGLGSSLLDRYLLLRLCSHVQQLLLLQQSQQQQQDVARAADFAAAATSGTAAAAAAGGGGDAARQQLLLQFWPRAVLASLTDACVDGLQQLLPAAATPTAAAATAKKKKIKQKVRTAAAAAAAQQQLQQRILFTPLPATVDCIHGLVLRVEKLGAAADASQAARALLEIYTVLLPTLVLLLKHPPLQQDLRTEVYVYLKPAQRVAYSCLPVSFFSTLPVVSSSRLPSLSSSSALACERSATAAAAASATAAAGDGGPQQLLQRLLHFVLPAAAASSLLSSASSNSSAAAATAASPAVTLLQLQHDRLLLQLLHLALLCTQRVYQFQEAAAYRRSRPPIFLPALQSAAVAATLSSNSPAAAVLSTPAAAAATPSARPGGGAAAAAAFPLQAAGVDWTAAATAAAASSSSSSTAFFSDRGFYYGGGGGAAAAAAGRLLQSLLRQWRSFAEGVSQYLAAAAVDRARAADAEAFLWGGGGRPGDSSSNGKRCSRSGTQTAVGRAAAAAAAEPAGFVGWVAAAAALLCAPLGGRWSTGSSRWTPTTAAAAVNDEAAAAEDSEEPRQKWGALWALLRFCVKDALLLSFAGRRAAAEQQQAGESLLEPLHAQLQELLRQQQNFPLQQAPDLGAAAAAVADMWQQLQHRRLGLRFSRLLWTRRRRNSSSSWGTDAANIATSSSSSAAEEKEEEDSEPAVAAAGCRAAGEAGERLPAARACDRLLLPEELLQEQVVQLQQQVHALVAAVRRAAAEVNDRRTFRCLSVRQQQALTAEQQRVLQHMQHLWGSLANAAMRTPHRMHPYERQYDDFSLQYWINEKLQLLQQKPLLLLFCCAVFAAVAVLGLLLLCFLLPTSVHIAQGPPSNSTSSSDAGSSDSSSGSSFSSSGSESSSWASGAGPSAGEVCGVSARGASAGRNSSSRYGSSRSSSWGGGTYSSSFGSGGGSGFHDGGQQRGAAAADNRSSSSRFVRFEEETGGEETGLNFRRRDDLSPGDQQQQQMLTTDYEQRLLLLQQLGVRQVEQQLLLQQQQEHRRLGSAPERGSSSNSRGSHLSAPPLDELRQAYLEQICSRQQRIERQQLQQLQQQLESLLPYATAGSSQQPATRSSSGGAARGGRLGEEAA